MCAGSGNVAAVSTAKEYAIDKNGATDATVNIVDGEIEVNATVEQKSFFAQLLGIDQITVPATASANCFPPNEIDKVLPIAWTCKPPDVGISIG